jgi:hypothetical protein
MFTWYRLHREQWWDMTYLQYRKSHK